jgi:peptide/nickel transport system substrate-binding protein
MQKLYLHLTFVATLLLATLVFAQGELVVGLQGDITAVDPVYAYDFTANPVVNNITEGLLKFKDGQTLEPNLAESWENPDPLTYIYKIRQGVTFQDGTPMTIDDVIFSMERTRNPDTASYVGWMYSNVDTIERTDDTTVTVKLKQPDALWQYVPATTGGHVISKAFFEANPETFGKPEGGVLGTGPFKFVSWSTGNEIVLEQYADYWDKANGGPYLERVVYKILPEATTRVAGLQTGEVQALLGTDATPSDQLPIVQAMENVTIDFQDSYLSYFLAFNTQRAPFDNVKVRQALNYALDKVLLTQNLYALPEAVTVARAVDVMPRLWTFEKEKWQAAYDALPDYAFDMEKAKQLLEESGVADQLNGKVITTDENPLTLGMALALQAAVAELGYNLEINKVTYQEIISISFSGARDYDIASGAWGSDFPDPSGNLLPVFHSRYVGDGGSNFGNYMNPEVDALLDEQNALTDNAERTDLMIQAQQIIANDSVWIVVLHPKQAFVLNNDFEGYTITPLWYWDAFAKNIKMKE